MQASQGLGTGSTEYYEWVTPCHTFRCTLLISLQRSRPCLPRQPQSSGAWQEQNWIDLDYEKEGGVKVMDYAAGTGILSQVS